MFLQDSNDFWYYTPEWQGGADNDLLVAQKFYNHVVKYPFLDFEGGVWFNGNWLRIEELLQALNDQPVKPLSVTDVLINVAKLHKNRVGHQVYDTDKVKKFRIVFKNEPDIRFELNFSTKTWVQK